jgi:hypothetical protein
VGIEDENVIYGPSSFLLARAWRVLGVDYVRIQAYWNAIAPAAQSPTPPAGFDPANPNDSQYNWGPLDAAIAAVRFNGMRVMLTLNQSGPRWASDEPGNATPSWKPNPQRFAQFATAIGRRYGAQVDRYLLGSEPNQLFLLAPQSICAGRRCTPDAPRIYRNLVNAAYPALKRADPGSWVLIGELAPTGSPPTSPRAGLQPLLFLRELACVDARFRPLRAPRCRGFRAARGDAFGYHPYKNDRSPPTAPTRNRELAKIGDINRLLGILDRITIKRRLLPARGRRFLVYFTEYGYISNPPNPRFGVSQARQARFLAEAAYLVWQRRSRIRLITQYQYYDDPTFPTGLLFGNGAPKASFFDFPHPFVIDTRRGLRRARFWGQVRPDAQRRVALQVRRPGRRAFSTVATIRTDVGGYWTRVLPGIPRGAYRFQYVTPTGTLTSATLIAPRR